MRNPKEIAALERALSELADFGEAEGLPGPTLTQAETMRKVAEALRWAMGQENGLNDVVEKFRKIDQDRFDA